jgi:cytochrome c biogenesis factor
VYYYLHLPEFSNITFSLPMTGNSPTISTFIAPIHSFRYRIRRPIWVAVGVLVVGVLGEQ